MTDDITDVFLTADKFFFAVEEKVWEDDLTYIEATLKVCSDFQIDPEDIYSLKLINSTLKDRLKIDGMKEGYLKKESQLPI